MTTPSTAGTLDKAPTTTFNIWNNLPPTNSTDPPQNYRSTQVVNIGNRSTLPSPKGSRAPPFDGHDSDTSKLSPGISAVTTPRVAWTGEEGSVVLGDIICERDSPFKVEVDVDCTTWCGEKAAPKPEEGDDAGFSKSASALLRRELGVPRPSSAGSSFRRPAFGMPSTQARA